MIFPDADTATEPVGDIVDPEDLLAEMACASGFVPPDPETEKLRQHLHEQQRALAACTARFKCGRAGRRAGKSIAACYWLTEGWRQRPGQVSLYVARTRGHARDILWEPLKALSRKWGWGAVPNESRLELVFPNGYKVILRGAENQREAEKFRGPFYWRVVIDEMHLYDEDLVKLMLDSIIRPALVDLRGECLLLGTPGYFLQGYWFQRSMDAEKMPEEAAKEENLDKQWPTYHWTMLANPFLPNAEEEMEEVLREQYGGDRTHPEFVREWLGEWVATDAVLVYPFDGVRNTYIDGDFDEELWAPSASGLKSVIGVDIGWDDGCGFSVAQKRWDGPTIRMPRSYSEYGLDLHEIARHIKRLKREFDTRWVYVDASAKGTIESLRNFGIQCERGIAGIKRPRIEYVRSALLAGTLQVHARGCQDLIGEWKTLPWELDDGGNVKPPGTHREGWVDECADSTLLSVLPLTQLWQERARDIPEEGTEEYERWAAQKRIAEAKARNERRKSGKRNRRKSRM